MSSITAAVELYQAVLPEVEQSTLLGFLAGYRGFTREAYTLDLRQFTTWCWQHNRRLFDVHRVDIECFARHLEDAGRARATVARRLSTIVGFYRYAEEEGGACGQCEGCAGVSVRWRSRVTLAAVVPGWGTCSTIGTGSPGVSGGLGGEGFGDGLAGGEAGGDRGEERDHKGGRGNESDEYPQRRVGRFVGGDHGEQREPGGDAEDGAGERREDLRRGESGAHAAGVTPRARASAEDCRVSSTVAQAMKIALTTASITSMTVIISSTLLSRSVRS